MILGEVGSGCKGSFSILELLAGTVIDLDFPLLKQGLGNANHYEAQHNLRTQKL